MRDPHLKVLYNRRGVSDYVLYDEAGIAERTGVTPAQYPEYAALRGDPSDNLPGVPGIGEKTAAKLSPPTATSKGSSPTSTSSPRSNARTSASARDRVFLNRQMSLLVSTSTSTSIPPTSQSGAWDRDEVRVLFDQLAFRTLLPAVARGRR